MSAAIPLYLLRRKGRTLRSVLDRTPVRCLAIAMIFGLLVLPVAIPYRVIVLAGAAVIWTWMEAGDLQPIGLRRHRLASTLTWSIGLAIVLIAFGAIVLPMIQRLIGMSSDLSAYGAVAGNATAALKLLGMALTSAAFGEEILFRGFLLHQLSAVLGSGSAARRCAIALSGLAFGLAHFIQGPFGIVSTGIVGAIFAWAWFRTGRNLWALILAHALVDSYGIAMLYFGLYA